MITGINMSAGLVITLLNAPLIGELRRSYQTTVKQRKESEQKAKLQERDRMKALFEMIETFSSTLNYQTVLQTAVDTALDAVGAGGEKEKMVGAVLLFSGRNDLQIHSARGFLPNDTNMQLPAEQGALSKILSGGGAFVLYEPAKDPELGRLLTLQNCSVALCLPLIRGMTAYGVMLFAHQSTNFFTSERVETLQMLSNQALISLQNARLYQDLDREKERLLQSQEEEKKKLARALHDGPTQSVAAIAMRINVARKLMESSTQEASEEMLRAEELARRTTQEIRHMLFMLRPLILENEGLIAALNAMAEKMGEFYQQKTVIDADPDAAVMMDAHRQAAVFSLVEESVNNARKHAQASEIWVRLKFMPMEDFIVVLEIIDNGVGFDLPSVMNAYDRRGSLGMINLRERTELINGQLNIDSVPGKGTRIRIFIPLNEEAADRMNNKSMVK
jgi:signal transduction histidine kinase